MAAVTIFSDFASPQNKVCHCFHCFPIYLPWSDAIILVFRMLSFPNLLAYWVQHFNSIILHSPVSGCSAVSCNFGVLPWKDECMSFYSAVLKIPGEVESRGFLIANVSGHVWIWELGYKESWAPKNWCVWTVLLEETLESHFDCKETQPVYPKGNQSWIFIGRTDAEAETLILWPPNAKNWLIWKDPDAGKDWKWEEKGTTEDKIVAWHHRLNGNEFE